MNDNELGGGGVTRRELLKGAGLVAVSTGLFAGMPITAMAAAAKPKKGGILRVGVVGSTNDILDGQAIVAKADQARLMAGFETLLEFDQNFAPENKYGLADLVDVKSTTQAVVRLKKGITFHNGKPVTADDLLYSWQRLLDAKLALPSYKALTEFMDPAQNRKIDKYTVEFNLKKGTADFKSLLAGYTLTVVPQGYTREGPQIGTGPYKVASFTPGRESHHVRNKNYWKPGKPYFDEIFIQDFADKTALVNALLSGQVDAAVDIPLTAIDQVKGASGYAVNEVSGGAWLCMAMMTDRAPFNDARVRQAMRLVANRPEILARALQGHGEIGNDLFGKIDQFYNANKYPQRVQDIAKAVSLLNAAGYTKDKPLEVDLPAPDDTGGLIPMAQAYAEQAKATGGVLKVTAKAMDSAYWDSTYAKVPFYTSYWSPRAYLAQIGATAGYGETLYEKTVPAYNDLYVQASGEADSAKRLALVKQLQKMDYEDGAYIIPVFNSFADAYKTKVKGIVNRPGQLNLDYYGRGFQDLYFG
jgi:peptide/nickel transport system substrate-binding protein